jgi:hypothetical protein
MVKRPTWMLLVILAIVVVAYYFVKNTSSKSSEPKPTVKGIDLLLTQSDGVLQSLRIYDQQGHIFQLQRDLSKIWVITAPTTGVADQGLAGSAEAQVGALRIVTILDAPPDLKEIGLAIPAKIMEFGFVNGTSHKIEIGSMTPTGSGYYVRYDAGTVYVISQSGIDALLNLLTAPPYPATETPSPTTESKSTQLP